MYKWLQWIRACGRLDLQPKGPEYAYQNCRLCHLHFEKKWYNINKINARLHPDAVPTLFGLHLEQDLFRNITTNKTQKEDVFAEKTNRNTEATDVEVVEIQEETSNANTSEIISSEILPITTVIHDIKTGKVKPSTSGSQYIKTSSDDSPRKRKLRLKIKRLQAQNRTLQ
ncbi:PREDICTED: 52 kDa repressor of the inhibitor of the protein kinase-like [Trachymyrmex cornetzi]|nr:PREDICTED: 52 kDa repressor of the inhibitor of the protein kinase-like [Trachymyrmex cornetzi]